MIALSCSAITKSYGTIPILNNISFGINEGDRVGLIGNNGAGKSTLFKILYGELTPDSGQIFLGKNLKLGYLKQEVDDKDTRSIWKFCADIFSHILQSEQQLRLMEQKISDLSQSVNTENPDYQELLDDYSHALELFEKQNGYGYKSEIKGVLYGLSFKEEDFNRSIHSLSGGQKSRLAIARLLLSKPDILLLDEPTNHLDINSVNWLENYLSAYNGTIVVITHDRYFLDKVVNHIFELENCKLISHKGSYSDFMKYKHTMLTSQIHAYDKQQKEIERQEELIRKFKQHGTQKLAKRAASREKRLDKIEQIQNPFTKSDKMNIKLHICRQSGKDVLFVRDLSMSFNNNVLFRDINFDIHQGERIGIIGTNGIGKTTLIKIILNHIKPTNGIVKFGYHVYTGYYDQKQEDVSDDRSLVDVISDAYPHMDITDIRTLLGSFMFYGDDVFKQTKSLSGGEKSRLALLKLMLSGANFLLLDEPTNHLDIHSKEVLEDALLEYGGTLLSISHDRYYLNKVCNKIFEMSADGLTVYYGNYNYYQNKKSQLHTNSPQQNTSVPTPLLTKTQRKAKRQKERELSAKKKERKNYIENLENDIHQSEIRIEQIDLELCKEAVYTDTKRLKTLHDERTELEKHLNTLYEQWELYL